MPAGEFFDRRFAFQRGGLAGLFFRMDNDERTAAARVAGAAAGIMAGYATVKVTRDAGVIGAVGAQ